MSKVSIIMPCYNDGAYIEEAIASVKAQTYKDIELIVVDDGSNDDHTLKVLNDKVTDSDIKLIRTNRLRPAGARNAGIAEATGKYILPLDSDDTIEPDYVEKAVNILNKNNHIGVVYCYADLFGKGAVDGTSRIIH